MINEIKIGNVLWLHLRPSIDEDYMDVAHPYLVINVNKFAVEILQLDTFDCGRNYRATRMESVIIPLHEPEETVILKDCYAHLEKLITIKNFDELSKYKKSNDVLSAAKLTHVQVAKDKYLKRRPAIKEKFIMNYTKDEILKHNPI